VIFVPGPLADDEKCQEFVANLKRMRALFKWRQEDLAAQCHVSKGVIANIESFQRAPLVEHGMAFDGAFGLKDVFAKASREIHGEAFPEPFVDFARHETEADMLLTYQHSFIPGLLQTERYARAVMSTWPNITAEEIDRLVAARLSRQQILTRTDRRPPMLWAIVDEGALRRPIAAPDVMREQLLHLVEMAGLPNVVVGVVPYSAGGHMGLLGACDLAEQDGHPYIVNLEDLADGRVSQDPAVLSRVALRFRALQQEALPKAASRDMIAKLAEELWNPTAPTGARALTAAPTADNT
jgi:transcriptional regulator with XRE-family HTH domain